jgi:hypothetical protein
MISSVAAGLTAVLCAATASAKSSLAWAGYQADRDTFRSISASWSVPTPTCPNRLGGAGDSYAVVGLGSNAGNIVGITVLEGCSGKLSGFDSSYIFNQDGSLAELPVNEGDQVKVTASVHYRAGDYYLAFVDHTRPDLTWYDRFHCTRRYGIPCSRAGAEVFAGKFSPPISGTPLADYQAVTFDHIAVTDSSGHHGSFDRNQFWPVTRLNAYNPLTDFALGPEAVASGLSHAGTQFDDVWKHY